MQKNVSLYSHRIVSTILIVLMTFSSGWYIASACIARHMQQTSPASCEKKCCSTQNKKPASTKQAVSCCCVTYAAAYIRNEHPPVALYELGKTTPFYSFSVLLAQHETPHQPPRG